MHTEKIESVMKKITALRNLANKAGTREEAEAAAAHAERLISEYHIEEAQLDAASTAVSVESVEEGDYLCSWEKQRASWIGGLAHGLCSLHGCYSFSTYENGEFGNGGVRIAGRASDVAIVRYLFGWLVYEINRLAQREHGRAARNAFRIGAVNGFIQAMRRAQESTFASQQAGKPSASIVLADRVGLAKRLFTTKGIHIHKTTTRISDGNAYDRGKVAGARLSPTSGLNAGTAPRMLGR